MVSRASVLKGAAVVIGVLLLAAGAIGAYALTGGFQEPTVEDVEVQWGDVTQDTAEIRATIVVDNPNAVGIPGVIDLEYTASLNDVTIAEGVEPNVGLSPGRNEIALTIPIDNQQIPEWWETHINRGEQSTLAIDATARGPFGISISLPPQEQGVETDILGGLESEESTRVSLLGDPVLTVGERTAEWGEASADTTPLTIAAEVTNDHDEPLTLDGVGYEITMNGVTMGAGEDHDEFTVRPGETETLTIDAAIETDAIDDWWVTHLDADETTTLSVETYAIVDGGAGDPTVELDLMSLSMDLQTDLLGGGGASTSDVSTTVGEGLEFEPPTVEVGNLTWGAVTDATTELQADLFIDNPNEDASLNELVDLSVRQTATINDVRVANESSTIEDLPSGEATRSLTIALDNAAVPEWWAAHVNNGETSTVRVNSSVRIDAGVTTFAMDVPDRELSFSTDLLAPMNADRSLTIPFRGRDAATVEGTTASWGQATAQRTPIDATVELRNELGRADLTVRDVGYTITMNEVTVANGTDPASVTIAPGETGTLAFTMTMNSQRMDEWWVSHIENDEETVLSVELTATIEARGETQTITIDLLGGDSTVTTDILGTA